jgi:hypothetical protein
MFHLSTPDYNNPENLCGKPYVRGDLRTSETPRSEKDWLKVCSECKIEYQNQVKVRQESWKNLPSPTFRERLERFANFGNGGSDHYHLVPAIIFHGLTFGFGTTMFGWAQKMVKAYLKSTTRE